MNITSYLIMMGVSSVVCCLMTFFLLRKDGIHAKQAGISACVLLVLGWILGVAGAKALYMLLMFPFISGIGASFTQIQIDQLAYYGGVAGVVLAAFLASRAAGIEVRRFLNVFAPAGAFMAAMARFSEFFLGMQGVGDYLEEGGFFPLAIENKWGEHYLAVFVFAGVFSLVAMVLAFVHRREKDCFVRTLFYLCLPQIFCESLRNISIAWLFVRAEQLLCYLFVQAVLIVWSLRIRQTNRRWFLPIVMGFVVCGLTVAEEFALDKSDIPHVITYACMVAGLIVLAVMENWSYRQIRAAEKN